MRKFLFAIALLLGIGFIVGRLAEVHTIVATLKRGDVRFLCLALGVQVLWYLNAGYNLKILYRALGLEESLLRLALMAMSANFFSVVVPSGGMSGLTVYISEARQRGYSATRATVAGVLYIFFEYVGFLFALALGLVVLIRRNHLTVADITASFLMALLAIGLGVLLYLGAYSGPLLGNVLTALTRRINRLLWPLLHRPYLSEENARTFALDAGEGLKTVRRQPYAVLLPATLGVVSKGLQLIILWLVFLAFQVPYSAGTIVAGYAIANLFLIISPTPSGIGIVEGILTVALNSLNVPLGEAAVVTLAYRGITFWLPFVLGPLAFRLLEHLPCPPQKPLSQPPATSPES
ncbi:MAG: flippase-like domain-containing protein [Chloroflexi bacterium]|nr:flippase-like domain-containing protein [Chloroflexota bacterium]